MIIPVTDLETTIYVSAPFSFTLPDNRRFRREVGGAEHPKVSCDWWRAGHVTQSSPLIGGKLVT